MIYHTLGSYGFSALSKWYNFEDQIIEIYLLRNLVSNAHVDSLEKWFQDAEVVRFKNENSLGIWRNKKIRTNIDKNTVFPAVEINRLTF